MQVRVPGEHVKPHEVHFKLHPAELPVKNKVNVHADTSLVRFASILHTFPKILDRLAKRRADSYIHILWRGTGTNNRAHRGGG